MKHVSRPKNHPISYADDVAAALANVARRLESIEAMLARQAPTRHRPLAPADLEALQIVLPAVADGLGHRGRIVTIGELIDDLAARQPERMRDLQRLLGEAPAKRLGKLLGRARGHNVAGLCVERCGTERGRAVWRVVAAVGF